MKRQQISPQHYSKRVSMLGLVEKTLKATSFADKDEALDTLHFLETVLDAVHHDVWAQVSTNVVQSYFGAASTGDSKEVLLLRSHVSRLFNLVPVYESAISRQEKTDIGDAILKTFNELFLLYNEWVSAKAGKQELLAV